jgi:outer membrane protein OmpU
MVKAAYQHDHSTAAGQSQDIGHYADFGIMVSPEMVEGLTIGYGFGELEPNTTQTIDNETLFVKYSVGGFTLGYQQSEADGTAAAQNDESEGWGISYAVNENMTIAYGERDYDDNTSDSTAGSLEQQDSGISASYTMGGMTIAGHMNQNDNVGGSSATTADKESYEFALTFAF